MNNANNPISRKFRENGSYAYHYENDEVF